jgi:hypothetical protein
MSDLKDVFEQISKPFFSLLELGAAESLRRGYPPMQRLSNPRSGLGDVSLIFDRAIYRVWWERAGEYDWRLRSAWNVPPPENTTAL